MDEYPVPASLFDATAPYTEEQWQALLEAAELEAIESDSQVGDVLEAMPLVTIDESHASWMLMRLREAELQLEARAVDAAVWHDQIDRHLELMTREDRRRAVFLRSQLEQWAQARRRDAPKGPATFKLLGGEVSTTLRKPSLKIEDQDALVAWARQVAPDAVERKVVTTERVPAQALKQLAEPGEWPRWTDVVLACGHRHRVDGAVVRGEVVFCEACPATDDGMAAEPVDVVEGEVTEPAPVTKWGPVPGVRVEPERIDVKITLT